MIGIEEISAFLDEKRDLLLAFVENGEPDFKEEFFNRAAEALLLGDKEYVDFIFDSLRKKLESYASVIKEQEFLDEDERSKKLKLLMKSNELGITGKIRKDRNLITMEELLDFLEELDFDKVKELIDEGIEPDFTEEIKNEDNQDNKKYLNDQEIYNGINNILTGRYLKYVFYLEEEGTIITTTAEEILEVVYDFLVLGGKKKFIGEQYDMTVTLGEENKGCLSEYDDPDIEDKVKKILEKLMIAK